MTTARASLARYMESVRSPPLAARLLGSAWSMVGAHGVARPLALPPGARLIGVGGATLGGSYKTPCAIALAEALAARGADVALVGHAYRARPGRARIVSSSDDVAEVGDDALFAAHRLARSRVDVVVGPSRQAAVSFAARRASWLVVDGLLQARPQRIARSMLLLDGTRLWGNGHCPPAGDLRAPPSALVQAADAVIAVHDDHGRAELGAGAPPREVGAASSFLPAGPSFDGVVSRLDRAIGADGRVVPLSELRGLALGLVLTIARPCRVIEGLACRRIRPVATVLFPDHHPPTTAQLGRATARTTHRIDAWLTTGKCATKLPSIVAGAPLLVLDHALRLPDRLVAWALSDETPADDLFPPAGAVG